MVPASVFCSTFYVGWVMGFQRQAKVVGVKGKLITRILFLRTNSYILIFTVAFLGFVYRTEPQQLLSDFFKWGRAGRWCAQKVTAVIFFYPGELFFFGVISLGMLIVVAQRAFFLEDFASSWGRRTSLQYFAAKKAFFSRYG